MLWYAIFILGKKWYDMIWGNNPFFTNELKLFYILKCVDYPKTKTKILKNTFSSFYSLNFCVLLNDKLELSDLSLFAQN